MSADTELNLLRKGCPVNMVNDLGQHSWETRPCFLSAWQWLKGKIRKEQSFKNGQNRCSAPVLSASYVLILFV